MLMKVKTLNENLNIIGKNLRNVYNFNTSYISGFILLLIAILKII